jgi:aspartyl-tRNA(Asn)/glutamyl-tRNA(Gln) amidotransferase subunit C
MKITLPQVEHIAELARLEFNQEELEAFALQLDSILAYFDKLKELDTGAVEATSHAVLVRNVFREDEVVASILTETCLENAPEKESSCFRVPKIIE